MTYLMLCTHKRTKLNPTYTAIAYGSTHKQWLSMESCCVKCGVRVK